MACPQLMAQMQMPMASAATGFNMPPLPSSSVPTPPSRRAAEAVIRERVTKEITTIPMGFALLDGKIRMELDLTQIKNKQMTRRGHGHGPANGNGPDDQPHPARRGK